MVLIILSIALIPLLALSLYQVNRLKSVLSDKISSDEITMASSSVSSMNAWIDSKVSELSEFAAKHPEMANADNKKIIDKLKSINEIDIEISGNTVTDKDGNFINDGKITGNLSDEAYFQQVKNTGETVVSDIIESKNYEGKIIVVAHPLLDAANNFKGIITSTISMSTVEKSIVTIQNSQAGYDSYLLSGSGVVIYHPDSGLLGKDYTEAMKSQSKLDAYKNEIMVNESGMIEYTDDDGAVKIAAYDTMDRTGWKLIVVAPLEELYADLNKTVLISMLLILAAAVLILVVSVFMSKIITVPIAEAVNNLEMMANADFTQKVPEKFLKRKDEIGILAKSMNIMGQSVISVIHSVIDGANTVNNNIASSSKELDGLSAQVLEVSSTTEEIAAEMEEAVASIEEMNTVSAEIENAISNIAEKAQNGALIAGEISKRAQDLKKNAVISQKKAYEIRDSIDLDMRKAIEQSKAVEQIDVLTEAILTITAQTNLLALNASIEAARAGEAGKGFAVVAEEIKKLAEDSKKTINKIQNVVKLVVASVENLSFNSGKALKFIDTTVIGDYKAMVDIGEKYYRDSESVQDMVTDFSATAEELLASMQNMVKEIGEITRSNSENAQGTQNIANRASDAMEEAAKVRSLMELTVESSDKLIKTVEIFKI